MNNKLEKFKLSIILKGYQVIFSDEICTDLWFKQGMKQLYISISLCPSDYIFEPEWEEYPNYIRIPILNNSSEYFGQEEEYKNNIDFFVDTSLKYPVTGDQIIEAQIDIEKKLWQLVYQYKDYLDKDFVLIEDYNRMINNYTSSGEN